MSTQGSSPLQAQQFDAAKEMPRQRRYSASHCRRILRLINRLSYAEHRFDRLAILRGAYSRWYMRMRRAVEAEGPVHVS